MGLFDFFKAVAPAPAKPGRRATSPTVNVGKRGLLQAAQAGRLEGSWQTWPTTPDAVIFQDWTRLLARSREQCQNNDHARKFVQLVRENVAGPNGFQLNAQIKDPNGKTDLPACKAIEEAYELWSKKGNFDVTGSLSRSDAERLAAGSWAQDGEFIAVFRIGKDAGPYGFAVQLMDPMLLHPMHFEPLNNGNHIRHGIEMNKYGRPVAYWFKKQEEMQIGYTMGSGTDYEVVPASNVIHCFVPELVGQKRGLPQTRTALWRMNMLKGFEDAAVVNARVGASKMAFYRDPDGDPDDADDLAEAEPGTFGNLGNKELVAWDPAFPNGEFDPFVKSCLRSISSGLGVSYNNLASDLTGVNFSSIRQGALDEREVWKGIQQWMISAFSVPVYEKWLEWALLADKITINGKPLKFERLEKYKAVSFQGRRWAWIDPSADVAAAEKLLALKLRSRTSIIREMGNDFEDTMQEISRDDDTMDKLGIVPEPTAGSPMSQPARNSADYGGDGAAAGAK
jgi:lambda family phage portal protein